MNVISLFDGMSVGQLALQDLGIEVDTYYASEIDKFATKVCMKNFPETVQLGTVENWEQWEISDPISLLLGGSPCQGFSQIGKKLNFEDPRSKLFFDYVRVLEDFEPKYFLLENVVMKQEYQDIISDILESVYSVEDVSNNDPQYFLKPVGVTESPILLEDQRDFSELHQNLHFSKRKPKGVRKGDVLITVAVTAGALLSYFKVTGGLQEVTEDEILRDSWKERWPWYMEGRNLSPKFGAQWWIHNIQRKDVFNEFLELYPGIPVTSAGGFSLGTLNYGGDKVKITKEFGDFLISKIENVNQG